MIDKLLSTLPDGKTLQVTIGLHWTAVVVEIDGVQRCGLASTLADAHKPHGQPDVPPAGRLQTLGGLELAALIRAEQPILAGVGLAAINALLPPQPESWVELNAEEVIAQHGAGKTVALVGHFPFIPRLRTRVGELVVLEQHPQPGDLPAATASAVIPRAEVVAITGTTLINHTLENLLALCSPQAHVILLGPSAPLSPVLFEEGIDLLCGSVVVAIEPVLRTVRQGGHFPQVHRAGVRLVCMERPSEK